MDFRSELDILIKLLSSHRINDDVSYRKIAQCIRNVGIEYYDIWLKFNKRYPEKYNKSVCEEIWNQTEKTNYGLYTLHQMANADNPSKYSKSKQKILTVLIRDVIDNFNTSSIANYFAAKFEHRFKCPCTRLSIWYEFIGHRWVKNKSTHSLRNLISTDIISDFKDYRQLLIIKNNSIYYVDSIIKLDGIIKKLDNFIFQTKIIRQLANNNRIFDPFFMKKLDENRFLTGFTNGVYDSQHKIFRDGNPDDYISLTTGYDYVDINGSIAMEIFEYLDGFQFVDIDDFLNIIIDCVIDCSQNLKLNILYEKNSNNNISELGQLIKYLLGDYFQEINKVFLSNGNINYIKYSKGKKICFFEKGCETDINPKKIFDFAKYSNLEFIKQIIFVVACDTISEKIHEQSEYVNIIEFEKILNKDDLTLMTEPRTSQQLQHWAPVLMSIIVSNHMEKNFLIF
jgi:hypothetical protein